MTAELERLRTLEEDVRAFLRHYAADIEERYPYSAKRLRLGIGDEKPTLVSTRFLPQEMEPFEFVNGHARVHPADACEPEYPCTIHRPSEHNMRDWPMLLRETGLIERICPDGKVGHPDPDSAAWLNRATGQSSWGVHGCDGCCFG